MRACVYIYTRTTVYLTFGEGVGWAWGWGWGKVKCNGSHEAVVTSGMDTCDSKPRGAISSPSLWELWWGLGGGGGERFNV